ncbi:MAG: DUF1570 domain-containing protein [Candidatus Omnitrophica bacterium]|nr:DUF1570 domain-containing protein [Candidatus Omnitrophota bacterium]MBU2044170.1 DUF1570 domain-containing protein [Candidatus Omnitrophota bacterium]
MKHMRYALLALLLLTALPAYSQIIELKSGKTIQGRITEQHQEYIKVEIGGVPIKYYFKDIAAINGQPILEDQSSVSSEDINKPVTIEIFAVEWNLPEDIDAVIHNGIWSIQGVFNKVFDLHFTPDFVAKVRIFGDDKYFFGYQRMSSTTSSSSGFYTGKVNEAVTYWRKDIGEMLALVFHEITHALAHNAFNYLPLWLDEGIAEYFEQAVVKDDFLVVSAYPERNRSLKQRLRWESVKDLSEFLAMPDEEWDDYNSLEDAPSRTMSWSIIYFLMETESGREALKKILHKVKDIGDQPDVSLKVFDSSYPGGVAQFEKDWHQWIPKERLVHVYPICR